MSERWGDCRSCGGKGWKAEIVYERRSVQGFKVQEILAKPPHNVDMAFEGGYAIIVAKTVQCGTCNGEGHSGDSADRPVGI